jgi:hypothetical protein
VIQLGVEKGFGLEGEEAAWLVGSETHCQNATPALGSTAQLHGGPSRAAPLQCSSANARKTTATDPNDVTMRMSYVTERTIRGSPRMRDGPGGGGRGHARGTTATAASARCLTLTPYGMVGVRRAWIEAASLCLVSWREA